MASNIPIYTPGIQCEWVTGRANGERAKSVLAHAAAGLSYFIIDQGKQGNQQWCLYAFLRPMVDALPDHLVRVVDPFMQKKLDERRAGRHGMERSKPVQRTAKSFSSLIQNRQAALIPETAPAAPAPKPTAAMRRRQQESAGDH